MLVNPPEVAKPDASHFLIASIFIPDPSLIPVTLEQDQKFHFFIGRHRARTSYVGIGATLHKRTDTLIPVLAGRV
jgi:hypothetical protein